MKAAAQPRWKHGDRSRSPYENAAAALHALRASDNITRSELREAIQAGADDHQAIRLWRWLLDCGFAVPDEPRRHLPGGQWAETIKIAAMWRGSAPGGD